tara:strand:- start:248 stop:655 length:408 start_codon:yes stop_codon:yes gene_type:complete
MLKNLLGIELSELKTALIFSYIGSFILMATGLMFALPSIFIEFTSDAPDFGTFAWILVGVGFLRLILTYLYANGTKSIFYILIVLSFLKVIEIPAAIVGESAGFIVWYALLTGIVEVLFLINIFSKSAREENKSN